MLLTAHQPAGTWMWWRAAPTPSIELSPEFHRAFVREVLKTRRLRMKAVWRLA